MTDKMATPKHSEETDDERRDRVDFHRKIAEIAAEIRPKTTKTAPAVSQLAGEIAVKVAEHYAPSGVPKHYRDQAVQIHATLLTPIISAAISEREEKLRDVLHLVYGMPCGQCGFSVGAHVPENELKCTSARAYQIAAALSALGESK